MQKICSKCGLEKVLCSDFFRDKRMKLGYKSHCKLCDISIVRTPLTFEKRKQYQLARKARKPYVRSREQRDRYNALARLKLVDKEAKSASDKRYRQSVKGKAQRFLCKARRRSRTRVHLFKADDWRMICEVFGNVCAYCKAARPLVRDHFVPLFLGGQTIVGNIAPSCHSCNSKKQSKLPFDWCGSLLYEEVFGKLNKS